MSPACLTGEVFAWARRCAAICGISRSGSPWAPDVLLWPVYCDYSVQEWNSGVMDEYALQCRDAAPLTLMINSICPPTGHGGCAAFRSGKTALLLPPGQEGLLLVQLDKLMKGCCT